MSKKQYKASGKPASHSTRKAESHGRRYRQLEAKGRLDELQPAPQQVVAAPLVPAPPSAPPAPYAVKPKRAVRAGYSDSIEELGLRPQTVTLLKEHDINVVGDLLDWPETDLLQIDGVGQRTVDTIKKMLARRGLYLPGTPTTAIAA